MAAGLVSRGPNLSQSVLSRFQRGGQRMLPVIPSCGLVQDVDHGGQISCCRERRAAA